jgi:hypothetical protein
MLILASLIEYLGVSRQDTNLVKKKYNLDKFLIGKSEWDNCNFQRDYQVTACKLAPWLGAV